MIVGRLRSRLAHAGRRPRRVGFGPQRVPATPATTRGSAWAVRVVFAALAAFAAGVPVPSDADGRETGAPLAGAVVTAHPLATAAGQQMLAAGGTAFDAAIAIATTLAVVEPFGSGLAGGGFWLVGAADLDTPDAVTVTLVGEPSLRVTFLDARETAPARIAHDTLLDADRRLDSALGAGIPGIPAALAWLERRARLDRHTLLAPAVHAAREGFDVRARHVQMLAYRAEALARSPDAAAIFLAAADHPDAVASAEKPLADGRPTLPAVGSRLVQPDLAASLETLAEDGFEAFYRGPFAERLVAGVAALGGLWTTTDLAEYRLELRRPLFRSLSLDGEAVDVVTAPLPSSGGLVLLELLEVIADTTTPWFAPRPSSGAWTLDADQAERVHRQVEAMRLAYAARAGALGDPDFLSASDRARVDAWFDAERLADRRARVADAVRSGRAGDSDALLAELLATHHGAPPGERVSGTATRPSDTAAPQAASNDAPPIATDHAGHAREESPQTTHFAVVDRDGRFVAATLTLNLPFGSGQVIPGTGLLLNNQLDDFATAPGQPNAYGLIGFEANAVAPGKRPLSSMTPTLIRTADADWLLGSPGGSRIITTVLHGALAAVHDAAPDDVVAAPRFHHQFLPDRIEIEPGAFTPELIAALQGYGHRVRIVPRPWGDLGAIRIDRHTGHVGAAADPRTDAAASP